jgi:hypothetical protein
MRQNDEAFIIDVRCLSFSELSHNEYQEIRGMRVMKFWGVTLPRKPGEYMRVNTQSRILFRKIFI